MQNYKPYILGGVIVAVAVMVAVYFLWQPLSLIKQNSAPTPQSSPIVAGGPPTNPNAPKNFAEFFAALSAEKQKCVKNALGPEFDPLFNDPAYLIRDTSRMDRVNECLR